MISMARITESWTGWGFRRLRKLGARDRSVISRGTDRDRRLAKNWILPDGSPTTLLSKNCGMAVDISPDHKFFFGSMLWRDNPGIFNIPWSISNYSLIRVTTFLTMFARMESPSFIPLLRMEDGLQSFWRNGVIVGATVPALSFPSQCVRTTTATPSPSLPICCRITPRGGYDDLYLSRRSEVIPLILARWTRAGFFLDSRRQQAFTLIEKLARFRVDE